MTTKYYSDETQEKSLTSKHSLSIEVSTEITQSLTLRPILTENKLDLLLQSDDLIYYE